VTKTGIVAAVVGLAAIVMVFIVAQGMRDSGFIVRAYVSTAVIIAGYVFFLDRRLAQVERGRAERK
jgi:ATP/ADP translocase